MTIAELRQSAIAANEKAATAQRYFEVGRCRRKQRDAARRAAEQAVAAYKAAALPGAVLPAINIPAVERRGTIPQAANDA